MADTMERQMRTQTGEPTHPQMKRRGTGAPRGLRGLRDLVSGSLAPRLVLGLFALSFLGCGKEDGSARSATDRITLERHTPQGWMPPTSAHLLAAIGYRDGARTRARFTLADSLGTILQVDLLVETNPLPVLVEGAWTDGEATSSEPGKLEAQDLHFLGGQGGPPSLGGQITLLGSTGEETIRLFLPPLPLEPIRPGSLAGR